MIKKSLFRSIVAVAAISMFMAACGEDEKSDDGAIDWTNYTNGAIFVRNSTGERLVAFKGSLSEQYKLGGIPAGAQNHGLKNNPDLFTTTQDFPMILITEDQYKTHRKDLLALEQTPFTRVYVFYNKEGDNALHYEISNRLGGGFILRVANSSMLNVELRVGGPQGPTLGYAPSGMQTTTLNVGPGDLDVFPVFKYYNGLRQIVETIYPTGNGNSAWFYTFGFEPGVGPQMLDITEALQTIGERTTGVAYLIINNQATSGGVRLLQGSNMVYTTTGVSTINSGSSRTFQIDMPAIPGSKGGFGDSINISSYRIGPSAATVALEGKDGETEIRLNGDYMYTVDVTGSHNNNTLKAVVELRIGYPGGPTKINMDNFVF